MKSKLDAIEQKERMYNKAKGRCHFCSKRLPFTEAQLAHIIPKHKKYLSKYGADIIHHEYNMLITCDKCNSKALLDPATHPVECAELVEKIKETL